MGARPQFVKAAVISREFKRNNIEECIIHTGQHFDAAMSDVFFQEMEIPEPNYNLGINSLNHGAMTGAMLTAIEEILLTEKPDVMLVYGDTNSTLAGALAASKLHIPVVHIEAGMRSFNLQMPEEINRVLTDRISSVLYASTKNAVDNLYDEGYDKLNVEVFLGGDVMQDAALYYAESAEKKSTIVTQLKLESYVLCTLHRAENTDNISRLTELVKGLNQLNDEIPVVVPLHPRTRKLIEENKLQLNAMVIGPVGYFDMISLIRNCSLVITDSGGLQKEAFFFGKNCVTMRDETEWVELVSNGFNVLVGADSSQLVSRAEEMMNKKNDFEIDLYGGGSAGKRIVTHLLNWFSNK